MDMPVRDEARGTRLGHHFDRTTQPKACSGTRTGLLVASWGFSIRFCFLGGCHYESCLAV